MELFVASEYDHWLVNAMVRPEGGSLAEGTRLVT